MTGRFDGGTDSFRSCAPLWPFHDEARSFGRKFRLIGDDVWPCGTGQASRRLIADSAALLSEHKSFFVCQVSDQINIASREHKLLVTVFFKESAFKEKTCRQSIRQMDKKMRWEKNKRSYIPTHRATS